MKESTVYQKAILAGLQRLRHVYGGTVSAPTKAKRRKENKRARKSRRTNR